LLAARHLGAVLSPQTAGNAMAVMPHIGMQLACIQARARYNEIQSFHNVAMPPEEITP